MVWGRCGGVMECSSCVKEGVLLSVPKDDIRVHQGRGTDQDAPSVRLVSVFITEQQQREEKGDEQQHEEGVWI